MATKLVDGARIEMTPQEVAELNSARAKAKGLQQAHWEQGVDNRLNTGVIKAIINELEVLSPEARTRIRQAMIDERTNRYQPPQRL